MRVVRNGKQEWSGTVDRTVVRECSGTVDRTVVRDGGQESSQER